MSLSGALLHVEDEEGKVVVEQWESTDEPHVIKGLDERQTYYVVEDSCPEGYLKMEGRQAFMVSDHDVEIFNEPVPVIRTRAFFTDNGLAVHLKTEKADVSDEVMIKNLTVGNEYLVKASLLNMEDDSVICQDEKAITADRTEMQVLMNFIECSLHEKMYVNEELYRHNSDGSYTLVSSHKGIDDPDQQVFVPDVRTEAVDDSDGDHQLFNSGIQVLKDTISYHNLTAGREYDVKTELYYADTAEPLTDENGEPLVFTGTFLAEKPDGETSVVMEIDAAYYKGHGIVIFEEISCQGTVIAVHRDLNDASQTVIIPDLLTQASCSHLEGNTVVLSDEVELIGFPADTKLEITAVVMDYATGEPLKDSEGNRYRQTVNVMTSGQNETVSVSLEVDGTVIDDRKLVFFEEGKDAVTGKLIVVHKDWNNEKQTVEYSHPAETGDISGLMLYLGLLGASMIAASVIMTAGSFRRKRSRSEQ